MTPDWAPLPRRGGWLCRDSPCARCAALAGARRGMRRCNYMGGILYRLENVEVNDFYAEFVLVYV